MAVADEFFWGPLAIVVVNPASRYPSPLATPNLVQVVFLQTEVNSSRRRREMPDREAS
jgi:hypothetical protein